VRPSRSETSARPLFGQQGFPTAEGNSWRKGSRGRFKYPREQRAGFGGERAVPSTAAAKAVAKLGTAEVY